MKQTPFAVPALALLAALSACASKPETIAAAPPPPPVVVPVAVPMPPGGYAGMTIPARLPDGSYATPNRDLTPAAATWHFRVALNVAALACRGAEGDSIVAAYNTLLTRAKAPLGVAETHYAAEFKEAAGKDWRAAYDDGMTRLYNFFSQSPARDAFCDAAAATLTDAAFVDDAALPGFAAGRLAVLEQPFTDFYRAYDAWRAGQVQPQPQAIYALSATPPAGPPIASARPKLTLDPSIFQDQSLAH